MKKGCFRTLVIIFCMILMTGSIGTGVAGKEEGYTYAGFFTSGWFYVKDSVPDYMVLIQNELPATLGSYWGERTELCEKATVKFTSGSKHLREAIKIRSDENGKKYFYVDNDVLTEPGGAQFRLSAESEHYQWSDDYYLKVIDYNEYPLLDLKIDNPLKKAIMEVSVGDRIEEKDILSAIGEFHLTEIEDRLWKQKERYAYYAEDTEPLSYKSWGYYWIDDLMEYKDGHWDDNLINYIPGYFIVKDYGVFELNNIHYKWGNVELRIPEIIIQTEPGISGKGTVRPGKVVAYYFQRAESKVSWSVEGDNVRIHPDNISSVSDGKELFKELQRTGAEMTVLEIDADAEYGSEITITATDEQGKQYSKKVKVGALLDENDLILNESSSNGFKWHYPVVGFKDAEDWEYGSYKPGFDYGIYRVSESIYGALYEDPDKAHAYLEGEKPLFNYEIIEDRWLEIEGHPAHIIIYKDKEEGKTFGTLSYVRNSLELLLYLESSDPNDPVEFYDCEVLAKHISYDETAAPFTVADAALSISTKGDQKTVTAGRNISFTYAFANSEKVNKKNKNDAVVWSVGKADTGEAVEGVIIDAKGQLKVDKNLAAPVDLQVKVASEKLGTSAIYNISALPVVSKVNVEPAVLFFYTGTEDPQTVKASLEPSTVPPIGLTWTPAKKDIVEITAVEDGTVSIKPRAAGKTDIAVKEPGGKNAKLTVNVVAPVESVELKANGTAKAGGKVKIVATLAPKNVGNKTVQWSVDVGEDIAKIDDKGQLTISKEAPSGTKITVTCTALGAPSPVVSTIVVEIP